MLFDEPHVNVTLSLRIHDAQAFRLAAYKQALAEGQTEEEAKRYLVDDEDAAEDEDDGDAYKSLSDCARMLFDPGTAPDGCDILSSEGESF